MEDDTILIRPDPDNMDLAFRADELLQQLVPKHRVRFLLVRNEKVRAADQAAGRMLADQPVAQDARRNEADDRGLENRHPRRRAVLLQQGHRHAVSDLRGLCASSARWTTPALRQHLAEIREFSAGHQSSRAAGSGLLHGRRRRFRRPISPPTTSPRSTPRRSERLTKRCGRSSATPCRPSSARTTSTNWNGETACTPR